ncbi:hypothetical protein [Caballeronia sordidicola]|uniref:D-alanine-D-alanine ligase n=1 Tax=Caballeronia sordidicola TaxID=196367 RepID=A0A242N445_CABSO|nr:hypothetical protein [Caballeronia sordidicola]OTP78448.1 D-alanine-D-alanine ligase [Caballeronia sordidicola]
MPIKLDPAPVAQAENLVTADSNAIQCSTLERMPKWLICVPLVVQWIGLALRYRSVTLPSAANPSITSGGLIGEGKLEYFRRMGPIALTFTAAYCQIFTGHKHSDFELKQSMSAAGLSFPVIAKPDLGFCGYGVRLLADLKALQAYLASFPKNETVVLQRYLPEEGEAGVFYMRDPDTDVARIIGLALRYFPRVTGDGRHTIKELISTDTRARRSASSTFHAPQIDDGRIPAAGEIVRLATIGSTRVGGLYRDGERYITAELTAALDAIARSMPNFNFGRFDVRYDKIEELSAGRGFIIMEINGAGSEAIHAWDPAISVFKGFQIIFAKQRMLFAVADAMRRRGVKPINTFDLFRLYQRQQRLIKTYPPSN